MDTVKQGKFLPSGEVVEEDTFATEGELQGFKESQAPMAIGNGGRPLEDLPLFGGPQPKESDFCPKCRTPFVFHNGGCPAPEWTPGEGSCAACWEEPAGPDGLCEQCRSKGANV